MRHEKGRKLEEPLKGPAQLAEIAKSTNDGMLVGELIRQVAGSSASTEIRAAALQDIARHFSDSNFIVVGALSALWVCDARACRDFAREILTKPFDRELDLIHAKAATAIIEHFPYEGADVALIAKVLQHQNSTVKEPAKRAFASLPHNVKIALLEVAQRSAQTPEIQMLIKKIEQNITKNTLTFPGIPRTPRENLPSPPQPIPLARGATTPTQPKQPPADSSKKTMHEIIRLTPEEPAASNTRGTYRVARSSLPTSRLPIKQKGDETKKVISAAQEPTTKSQAPRLNKPAVAQASAPFVPSVISIPRKALSSAQIHVLTIDSRPDLKNSSTATLDAACEAERDPRLLLSTFCELAIRDGRSGVERHIGRYVWLASHPELSANEALSVLSELFRE